MAAWSLLVLASWLGGASSLLTQPRHHDFQHLQTKKPFDFLKKWMPALVGSTGASIAHGKYFVDDGDGIVACVERRQRPTLKEGVFHDAAYMMASITRLRDMGVTEPIVIYHSHGELGPGVRNALMKSNKNVIVTDLDTIVDKGLLEANLGSWTCKLMAMLYSPFKRTMLMDPDAVFFQDPRALWSQPVVQDTGMMLFWDDRLSDMTLSSCIGQRVEADCVRKIGCLWNPHASTNTVDGTWTGTCRAHRPQSGAKTCLDIMRFHDGPNWQSIRASYPEFTTNLDVTAFESKYADFCDGTTTNMQCSSFVMVDKSHKNAQLMLKTLHDMIPMILTNDRMKKWSSGDKEFYWIACELGGGRCGWNPAGRPMHAFVVQKETQELLAHLADVNAAAEVVEGHYKAEVEEVEKNSTMRHVQIFAVPQLQNGYQNGSFSCLRTRYKNLTCAADAGNGDKRIRGDEMGAIPDTFVISTRLLLDDDGSVSGAGTEVCAQRTDQDTTWDEPVHIVCEEQGWFDDRNPEENDVESASVPAAPRMMAGVIRGALVTPLQRQLAGIELGIAEEPSIEESPDVRHAGCPFHMASVDPHDPEKPQLLYGHINHQCQFIDFAVNKITVFNPQNKNPQSVGQQFAMMSTGLGSRDLTTADIHPLSKWKDDLMASQASIRELAPSSVPTPRWDPNSIKW